MFPSEPHSHPQSEPQSTNPVESLSGLGSEPVFFQFEADFVDSLRCIPMQVRLKLDTCGIKLTLQQWHQFSQGDRQELVTRPCAEPSEIQHYRAFLQQRVVTHTGALPKELEVLANPPWLNVREIPPSVLEKAHPFKVSLSLEQWTQISPLQRFALIKLSRSGHEGANFSAALHEFGLGTVK